MHWYIQVSFSDKNEMSKIEAEIIYVDDEIIVVNKPAGVSVTKDRGGTFQLLDIFAEQLGAETAGKLRLVHRLDKHTSGVMMLAFTREAQSRLSSYVAKGLMKKTYLAIVTGVPPGPNGTIKISGIK